MNCIFLHWTKKLTLKNAISTTLSYLFLSLLTSSICLFYITIIKLNKHIKIILCSLALVNITTILLSIVSNVLIILFSQTTFFTCLIFNQVAYVIVYENISAVSLISGAKYSGVFSSRSLKTRKKLISFSQLVLLSLYIFWGKGFYFSIFGGWYIYHLKIEK